MDPPKRFELIFVTFCILQNSGFRLFYIALKQYSILSCIRPYERTHHCSLADYLTFLFSPSLKA